MPSSHETQCPELSLQAHSPFFPPHPNVFSLSQPRAAWRDQFSPREEQVGESGAPERLLLGKRERRNHELWVWIRPLRSQYIRVVGSEALPAHTCPSPQGRRLL